MMQQPFYQVQAKHNIETFLLEKACKVANGDIWRPMLSEYAAVHNQAYQNFKSEVAEAQSQLAAKPVNIKYIGNTAGLKKIEDMTIEEARMQITSNFPNVSMLTVCVYAVLFSTKPCIDISLIICTASRNV